MKKAYRVFLVLMVCFVCMALVVGCSPKEQPEAKQYQIKVAENIANGTLQCDKTTAKAGETVTVTATAAEHCQLVNITVNGEIISGNTFTMPEKDVVVSATFDRKADVVAAVPEGMLVIDAASAGGASARGNISLTFTKDGILFTAYVEDNSPSKNDGVAILFSREDPTINALLKDGKTVKVSVNYEGKTTVLATDAKGELVEAALEGVTTDFGTWSKTGETLDGYFAEILVPYAVLGTTAENAKGSVTVCPVVYSAFGSLAAQSKSLEDVQETAQNTFAVLLDDNTVRPNKYVRTAAQFGPAGSLSCGEYWDLSKDYYKEDTENYPNREVNLTGHDGNDNNLLFSGVSANEMYVRAKITLTGVSNPNDQWPKFGLMLFDGASKNGVFFYVDAVMSGNSGNTLDNITGTAVGYNRGTNGEYGTWNTARDGVFNLATDTILLEMVYQDGWVHMYADGVFIQSVYSGAYNENLHFGIKSFGIDMKVTDYLASDDAEADGWTDKMRPTPETQKVDILFAGDSYMDFWTGRGMANCLSYTGATYANAGIGGTKVSYWIDKVSEMEALYAPSKIAFHIGVNDIDDAGAQPGEVIAKLKTLFELYHSTFPNATIYWNSLIPNTMFAAKYSDYQAINAAVSEYAAGNDWLVYINQTEAFEYNGAARLDVFDDGLHLSTDLGYPIWAKTMLTAMGYERVDGETMGDCDRYAHSGNWEFGTNEAGKEYAYSDGELNPTLWFKDVSGENVYAEAVISIGALRNADGFPKFGLVLRGAEESRWGIIDVFAYPNELHTNAALIYRGVDTSAGYAAQTSWRWDNTAIWGGATNCDPANVKLAIAKLGNQIYFLVNDTVYLTTTLDGEVSVGYVAFNLETTITDVMTSTDVATIQKKLNMVCEDAEMDGIADDSIWTEEVLANAKKFGEKYDNRYFTVAAVKGSDGVYFLINTYTHQNIRDYPEWYNNANIEFRFGNDMDTQQYIYVQGAGFNAVKSSGGITVSGIHANEMVGGLCHTTFEFFAPYQSFAGYSAGDESIPLKVWGWVWDGEGWNNIMNVGVWPTLVVTDHGLEFI